MPLKPVKNGLRNSHRQTANLPKDERMYLLVKGGEHILSMDENSPETDNKDQTNTQN